MPDAVTEAAADVYHDGVQHTRCLIGSCSTSRSNWRCSCRSCWQNTAVRSAPGPWLLEAGGLRAGLRIVLRAPTDL